MERRKTTILLDFAIARELASAIVDVGVEQRSRLAEMWLRAIERSGQTGRQYALERGLKVSSLNAQTGTKENSVASTYPARITWEFVYQLSKSLGIDGNTLYEYVMCYTDSIDLLPDILYSTKTGSAPRTRDVLSEAISAIAQAEATTTHLPSLSAGVNVNDWRDSSQLSGSLRFVQTSDRVEKFKTIDIGEDRYLLFLTVGRNSAEKTEFWLQVRTTEIYLKKGVQISINETPIETAPDECEVLWLGCPPVVDDSGISGDKNEIIQIRVAWGLKTYVEEFQL